MFESCGLISCKPIILAQLFNGEPGKMRNEQKLEELEIFLAEDAGAHCNLRSLRLGRERVYMKIPVDRAAN
jgi:hypothetical protein